MCICWALFMLSLFSFVHSTVPLPKCKSMWAARNTIPVLCHHPVSSRSRSTHPLTRVVILSWPGNDPHDALWLHENKHSEHINSQLSFSPSEHSKQKNCPGCASELCCRILTFTYTGKTRTMTSLCVWCTRVNVHSEHFQTSKLPYNYHTFDKVAEKVITAMQCNFSSSNINLLLLCALSYCWS